MSWVSYATNQVSIQMHNFIMRAGRVII
jgi:hypothetical protein